MDPEGNARPAETRHNRSGRPGNVKPTRRIEHWLLGRYPPTPDPAPIQTEGENYIIIYHADQKEPGYTGTYFDRVWHEPIGDEE
jgi:hypothetical protein